MQDDKVLIVSYCGNAVESVPEKVKTVIGEYIRTEPGCFRKDGGGKIHFTGGYWYIVDRLSQQVAWVQGTVKTVPASEWQTRGEGALAAAESIFGAGAVNLPITVEYKLVQSEVAAINMGPGCSEAMAQCWAGFKDKVPHEHRHHVETVEAKAIEAKLKAHAHTQTAKEALDEYAPVVKQKGQEAYTACFEFWTHPDTQDAMKKMAATSTDAVKYCLAGCLAVVAGLLEQAFPHEAARAPALDNGIAMDASYVKLDSGSPVLVEPSDLSRP